jgi:hypothetical protein
MHCLRPLALGALLVGLGSCSSIVQGTDQAIIVNTNPPEATCALTREGQEIGAVLSTPGSVTVSRTKHDITISCEREGYQTATFIADSGWESGSGAAGIALDVILTLGVSSAIDSATGADNRYQSPVNITMVPAAPENALSSEKVGLSDGEWSGEDGEWQLSLTIEDGSFTGEARRGDTDVHQVTGKLVQDNVVDGRVARKGNDSWATLSGFFPKVLLIQDAEIEATIDLEEKS